MELVRFARLLRQRWRLLGAFVLVGIVGGFVSASVSADVDPLPVEITRYRASHTLINNNNLPSEKRKVDTKNLAQMAQRVTQGAVPARVAGLLDLTEAEVTSRTSIVVDSNSQSMEITAVGETATSAVELADALGTTLLLELADDASRIQEGEQALIQQRLDVATSGLAEVTAALATETDEEEIRRLRDDENRLANDVSRAETDLQRKIAEGIPLVPLQTLEPAVASEIGERAYEAALVAGRTNQNILNGFGPTVFDEASGPRQSGLPIPTSPTGRALIGAAFGLFLAVALVLLLDRMDPRLRTKDDVEEALDLPVVAEIPPLNRRQQRETEVLAFTAGRSRAAEAYRMLRSSLDYARSAMMQRPDRDGGAQVVLITSPGPSEGKTTTVANTAVVMAEADQEVLVVNCDFRRPRLTDYLGGSDRAQQVNLTAVPGVHLITHVLPEVGSHTPAEVLAAQRRVIERARDRFDVILLDTAPLLTTNDAADILEAADHVVLVVSTTRTTREAADRAVELLERRKASILGVTLIGARDVPNAREYYYDGDDPYLTRNAGNKKSRSGARPGLLDRFRRTVGSTEPIGPSPHNPATIADATVHSGPARERRPVAAPQTAPPAATASGPAATPAPVAPSAKVKAPSAAPTIPRSAPVSADADTPAREFRAPRPSAPRYRSTRPALRVRTVNRRESNDQER
ncbi:MAG: hypothetical protein HKN26_05765 [Acidimicrobiales bacterium]|nr:hypothetical protein [Acidimicrobiales bacterium]